MSLRPGEDTCGFQLWPFRFHRSDLRPIVPSQPKTEPSSGCITMTESEGGGLGCRVRGAGTSPKVLQKKSGD